MPCPRRVTLRLRKLVGTCRQSIGTAMLPFHGHDAHWPWITAAGVLLALGLLLAGSRRTPPADAPRTVAAVDLPRYLGTWYGLPGCQPLPGWRRPRLRAGHRDLYRAAGWADRRAEPLRRCRQAARRRRPGLCGGRQRRRPAAGQLLLAVLWGLLGVGARPRTTAGRWSAIRIGNTCGSCRAARHGAADYAAAVGIARAQGFAVEALRPTRQDGA